MLSDIRYQEPGVSSSKIQEELLESAKIKKTPADQRIGDFSLLMASFDYSYQNHSIHTLYTLYDVNRTNLHI